MNRNPSLRAFALWVVIVLALLGVFTLFQTPGSRPVSQDAPFSQLTARPPQDVLQWATSVAISWLPFVALIVVWIFLSRRTQASGRVFGFGQGATPSDEVLADPQYWRHRADEARAVAGRLADHDAKRRMADIAKGYEYLAQRAEERVRGLEKST